MSMECASATHRDVSGEPRAAGHAGEDAVLPFWVESLDVRGRAVRLGASIDRILRRHKYPEPVSRLVAEAIILASLLGTSLKFDGRFILQTQTDGPVSMIVVDFRSPGQLRAYAKYDADKVTQAAGRGTGNTAGLLGKGHLAMTVDQGAEEKRYQGIVQLDGATLEEIAHRYFRQSEQIPTRVRLAVDKVVYAHENGGPCRNWRGGGLIVQFLPANPRRVGDMDLDPGDAPAGMAPPEPVVDDAWAEATALVGTIEDAELTAPEITPETLLSRVFCERDPRVFPARPLVDKCRCDRRSVAAMIKRFRPQERRDMAVDGRIGVTCEFCGVEYDFDAEEFVG